MDADDDADDVGGVLGIMLTFIRFQMSIEQRFHRSFVKPSQLSHGSQLHIGFAIGLKRVESGNRDFSILGDFSQR